MSSETKHMITLEAEDKATGVIERASTSIKNQALALNNLATGALGLYHSLDKVSSAQLTLDKASIDVKTSTKSLEDAQRKLDKVMGDATSTDIERKRAQDELTIAQERHKLSLAKMEDAQKNVNSTMLSSALTVIPSVITMVGSLGQLIDLGAVKTRIFAAAQVILNAVMAANPIMLVVTALAAIAAALTAAYFTCEPFRNAVDAIGSALMNGLKPALDWIWNALTLVWNTIRDNPILALISPITAIIYLLSHWSEVMGVLGRVWDAVLGGMRYVWDHTIGPVLDALGWVWNTLTGAAGAITGPGVTSAEENIPGFQTGGVMPHTGLAYLHAGERIIPPHGGGGSAGASISIAGPLVYISGNADDRIVKKAANEMLVKLKSVTLEKTSSAASTYRIRSPFDMRGAH